MKASDIEDEIEGTTNAQVRQLADIPFDKGNTRYASGALSRLLKGGRGEIDPDGLLSMANQVDDVGPRATVQV